MRNHLTTVQCLILLSVCVIGIYSYRNNINSHACTYTPTTVSGTKAPSGRICKGQLLLNEKFTDFDRDLWRHELTLGGGGVSVLYKCHYICVCVYAESSYQEMDLDTKFINIYLLISI